MIEKFEVIKNPVEGYDIIKKEVDYFDCTNIEITIIKTGITKTKAERIAKLLNE